MSQLLHKSIGVFVLGGENGKIHLKKEDILYTTSHSWPDTYF